MTCNNQSECFTSAYQNYAFLTFLKFLYNIGSRNKVFSFEWQIDPFIARYLPIITYSTMVKYCTARSIGLFHVSMQTCEEHVAVVRQDDGRQRQGVQVDLPQDVGPFDLLDGLVCADRVNL